MSLFRLCNPRRRQPSRRPLRAALTLLAAAATACVPFAPLPAHAGAYTFTTPGSQRTINAGIVLLDSTTPAAAIAADEGPNNPDPYPFYILSRRVDLLPPGWTIQNPLASHNIAADVQRRWNARTNTSYSGTVPPNSLGGPAFYANNNGAYQFGQNVTPAMAPYWEVHLADVSTQDLQQYDVLLINLGSSNIAKLRPAESEKLRRFVDGGGTLLVEDNGGGRITDGTGTAPASNAYGPLFFAPPDPNTSLPTFLYAGPTNVVGTARFPALLTRSPILTSPYYLAQSELNMLGNRFAGDYLSAAPTDFVNALANQNGQSVLAAKSYGAGAIVLSATGTIAAINDAVTQGSIATSYGVNSGPFCGTSFQAAPTQDLKFLADIIAWSGGHTHEHQSSRQNGEALSALPSPIRTWNYTPITPGAANVPGAAFDGSFVYTVDLVNGVSTLHAFDLYPYEDLNGDGNPDDGSIIDYNKGSSADEVWSAPIGQALSAPTIAKTNVAGNAATIFVEGADGTIKAYQSGSSTMQPVAFAGPSASGPFNTLVTPPAPTFYDGRLYASEPDGTLFVYDFTAGRSASTGISIKLADSAGNPAIPTGAPAVGSLPSTGASTGTTPQSTDNVAFVPTGTGLFTLFLGTRGEQLRGTGPAGNSPFNVTHLPSPAAIDIAAAAQPRAYSLTNTIGTDGGGYANIESLTASARLFSGTAVGTPVYADYDAAFDPAVSLTRTLVTYGGATGGSGIASTPALDRFGNAYAFMSEPNKTDYQILASLNDALAVPGSSGARLPWRFRLPGGGDNTIDADGVSYVRLEDFKFQGTPVTDSRGFVYALATNGTQTALLSFNGQQAVTTAPLAADIGTGITLTQTDSAGNSEFGATGATTPLLSSQYSQNGAGSPLTFSSFGASSGGPFTTLTPNLNEPQLVTATFAQTQTTGGGAFQLALHTNLIWYSILKTNVSKSNPSGNEITVTPGEGITKVGGSLFFVGSVAGSAATHLYSVPADPQAAGYTIDHKFVDAATTVQSQSFVTDSGDTGVGATAAVASGAGGALVVSGANGVAAFLNRTILVTDNSRVMELNQDGSAAWLADSTQANAGLGVSSLALSRPSSITELTPNDYLVADTGNNRVVRFDRAGQVVWELTRFADPNSLLSASEPGTLNQPTSVQIRQALENGNLVVHYLVSDTGNYRILDIADMYGPNGNVIGTPHTLVWISHTHDKQQREYRYESAAYFNKPGVPGAGGTTTYPVFVVALVTNRRLAQPLTTAQGGTPGSLRPAAQDAPGGSIVLLSYDPTAPVGSTTNGYVATVIDHVQAYINNNGTFDLTDALANAGAATPDFTATPTTLPILRTLYLRNPRFLKAYTPAYAGAKGPNMFIADDNGVFDMVYDAGVIGGRPPQYFTQWGFTQPDYRALANRAGPQFPTPPPTVPYNRSNIPFVPQSLQRIGTDMVAVGNGSVSIGRYLVVNGYSRGNVSNRTDDAAFGGEVFVLAVPPLATGGPTTLATDIVSTLSSLSNTSSLAQPTFAFLLQ